MKNWSNFYTPSAIANEIVSMIPKEFIPEVAIDICVGSGNFLNAAANNWQDIMLVGVDINTSNINDEIQNKYQLYQFNALMIDKLRDTITLKSCNKLILANPPFGNINITYDQSVDKSNLELSREARKLNRIEALMLVSNISLMNNGDYFGAIIPENFFTSDKFFTFRKMFLSCFKNVEIGCSKKYFANSDVRTRTFIGKYDNKVGFIKSLEEKHKKTNLKLSRGIDNSKLLDCNLGSVVEVLHFSNKRGEVIKPKFTFLENKRKELLVENNDTLIIRVGRNSGLVFNARKDFQNKYISDYFYLLKGAKLSNMNRIELQNILMEKTKGLTTKYITKGVIENSINSVLFNNQ